MADSASSELAARWRALTHSTFLARWRASVVEVKLGLDRHGNSHKRFDHDTIVAILILRIRCRYA